MLVDVLTGLTGLTKVDQLTRYDYLKSKILIPTLGFSRERGLITPQEETILLALVIRMTADKRSQPIFNITCSRLPA